MEPNESGLSSYYHHQQRHHSQPPPLPQQQQQQPSQQQQQQNSCTAITTASSPTNGIPPTPQIVYSHSSIPSAVSSPLETAVKRKRGRPRKYGTPEQAAAAKRLSSSSSSGLPVSPLRKKEQPLTGGGGASSSTSGYKKSQLASLGNSGQGFTPHIITVAAGEFLALAKGYCCQALCSADENEGTWATNFPEATWDVGQKIMIFLQQSKREICILSAAGSISNVSLRQPATSGGNITYEGCFDILSLSGSYVHTDHGGRTGGLSVCLSTTDGQIIGGGIGGPLTAAGPVQVIVGTFLIDSKKDSSAGVKVEASGNQLPTPVSGTSVSSAGFRSVVRGSDDQQDIGGGQFMLQSQGMQVAPLHSTDWMGVTDTRSGVEYEFSGRMDHGGHQSPENGDYDQIPDRD